MKNMNVKLKDKVRELIFNESIEYIQEKVKNSYNIHKKIDKWYANNMLEITLACKSSEE